jgi:hypothetical protein
MIIKLNVKKMAIAFPLNIAVFAKGKKAITISKKMLNCFTNFVIISTGVVNLKTS